MDTFSLTQKYYNGHFLLNSKIILSWTLFIKQQNNIIMDTFSLTQKYYNGHFLLNNKIILSWTLSHYPQNILLWIP